MEEEVDDYMSDAFLKQLEAAEKNNSEASRCGVHKRKRDQSQSKKEEQKKPKLHVLESQRREEGLNTPISEDSKGFKMLAAMGFKPGSGLGKNQQGLTQPISVEIRDHKSGLGAFEEKKAAEESEAALQKLHAVVSSHKRAKLEEQFQNQTKSGFNDKKIIGNIHTALKAIANLEEIEKGQEIPEEKKAIKVPEILSIVASLPLREAPVSVHTFLTEELSADRRVQHLLDLIEYLRDRYLYCIYCGATYTSPEELDSECPGPLYEDHN